MLYFFIPITKFFMLLVLIALIVTWVIVSLGILSIDWILFFPNRAKWWSDAEHTSLRNRIIKSASEEIWLRTGNMQH